MQPAEAPVPRAAAIRVLRTALAVERQYIKAHAAEALLRHGLAEGVREVFVAEAAAAPPKYRVVTWRVLAAASVTADERQGYERLIRAAALDERGPDRAHGIEAWAKLGLTERPTALVTAASRPELRPYACWALVASGESEDEAALADLLRADDATSRLVSAYALMSMPTLRPRSLSALRADSSNLWVLAALHAHAEDAVEARARLLALLTTGSVEDRRLAATAFARRADPPALPALIAAMSHEDPDVRIYSAEAVLKATAG